MIIRSYLPSDLTSMATLFYETVHTVNARDYTEKQLCVWATGIVDLEAWHQSFTAHHTLIAEENGKIVGFADMNETGYLDRLYVHKDFQGRGIATKLCDALEQASSAPRFSTHASITARPFFEHRGYRVEKEQQVERQGVLLTNYVMTRER